MSAKNVVPLTANFRRELCTRTFLTTQNHSMVHGERKQRHGRIFLFSDTVHGTHGRSAVFVTSVAKLKIFALALLSFSMHQDQVARQNILTYFSL